MTITHFVRALGLAIVAALLLTLAGGFGSDAITPVKRAGYWLLIMLSATLFALGALAGVRALDRASPRPLVDVLLVSFCTAIPTTMIIIGADATFLNNPHSLVSAIRVFGLVLVISMVMTSLNFHFEKLQEVRTELSARFTSDEEAEQTSPEARIKSRLPNHLRHVGICALQAEDHYLRVHSENETALILMRLSDAIEEATPIEGLQTHRSWWVARSAVENVTRSAGRATLTLKNGLQVPVGRTYAKALQEAGWLDTN